VSRTRSARVEHGWTSRSALAALLAVIGPGLAFGQDRGGLPVVTPSPLNTSPPGAPRLLEPPPAPPTPLPPIPGPGPLLVPVPPAPIVGAARTRIIDIRPDSTGFVPERPPGPPVEIPRNRASEQVDELIDVVRNAEAEINVVVGRSRLIQTREPLTRIAISNPSVADIELINDQPNSRLLNLYGRSYGTTDLTLWDAHNRPTTFLVRVTIDTRDLEARLKQVFPGADIRIKQAGQQIILEGQVSDAKTMSEVLQIVQAELRLGQTSSGSGIGGAGGGMAAGMTGGAAGGMTGGAGGGGGAPGGGGGATGATSFLINRVRVPGPRQIMLHVKIAELNRTAIRQIGVNWLDTRNNAILGSGIGGVGNIAAASGAVGPLGQTASIVPKAVAQATRTGGAVFQPVTSSFAANAAAATTGTSQLFGIFNAGEFSLFINALRSNSLAKVLAEPSLVTLDGQPAKFLAGGMFPYPVAQPSSTGGGSVVTIQFAPFGALLSFLPHILADDVIRLDVEPAFSELNFATGTATNGTAVPGINQRSARTIVEMREGQTLAIAGLLQTSTQASTARIPGLGDLPIVGNLFSETQISTVETELVVLVTPELVAPIEASEVPPTAADRVIQPNDFEFYFLNRIEGKTGKDFRATVRELDPLDVMKHFQSDARYVVGPHGYVD
jgi:pilus assembly protein CpaC